MHPSWKAIPDAVREIKESLLPSHSKLVFSIPLDIDAKHTYGHPCGTKQEAKICLPPHLVNKAVLLHETGHILCRRAARAAGMEAPYPPGWNLTYEQVTGQPYVGEGNSPLGEGCAEAQKRELENPPVTEEQPAPFGWVGGKKNLKHTIVALIPPHKTYVEPFAGAASVFWAKEPSQIEVLNDMDADLMRFYRSLGSLKVCDLPREAHDWEKLKAKQGSQSPCAFLANVQCSFGNKREHKVSFAQLRMGNQKRCAGNAPQFHANLPHYRERIKGVKLHNEDWEAVVRRYDNPNTFFYLDPPYHGTSANYVHREDQLKRLAQALPRLKGKWLLSYDDHPDVRQAFKQFHLMPVTTNYTLSSNSNQTRGKQLLIANYSLRKRPTEAVSEGAPFVPTPQTEAAPFHSPDAMLSWQYRELIAELGELQRHGSDPTCPCTLADSGEYCLQKHALGLHTLAKETAAMAPSHAKSLTKLAEEALDYHEALKDRIVCGKPHKDEGDVVTWARDWRKKIEPIYYACKLKRKDKEDNSGHPLTARKEAAMKYPLPLVLLGAPAKEPWQMTKTQWEARSQALTARHQALVEGLAKKRGADALDSNTPVGRDAFQDALDLLRKETGIPDLDFGDIGGFGHKANVRLALSEGKPVPPEVLKDYPDLAVMKAVPPPGMALRKGNPIALSPCEKRHRLGKRLEKCVLAIKAKPPAEQPRNPYAVCRASVSKKVCPRGK